MVIWHCAEMVLHDYRYCIHEDMLGTYAHFAAPLPHQIRHCVKGARRLAPDWHEDLGAIGIAADQRPSWLPVMPPWEREASCCCERLRVKREGYLDLIHHVEVALLQLDGKMGGGTGGSARPLLEVSTVDPRISCDYP